MKTKKLCYVCLGIALMLLMLLVGTNYSYADSTNLNLGLKRVRESGTGYRYQANAGGSGKTIWKIVSYDSANTVDWSKAIYCVRAEQGFGSDWTNDSESTKVSYNIKLDMKNENDRRTILNSYNQIPIFSSESNYNKLLWLMDNIYLPKNSTEAEKAEFLKQIPALTTSGQDSNLYKENQKVAGTASELTDDDIEAVQQMATWYFTNQDDSLYHTSQLKTIYINKVSGTDANYVSIEEALDDKVNDLEYGAWKKEFLDDIYNYLITTAETKSEYTGVTSGKPLSLKSSDAKVSTIELQNKNNLLIGPYSINKDTNAVAIPTLNVKDQQGNLVSYQLLDKDKNIVTDNDISKVVGQQFYIAINKSNTITKINISLDVSYSSRNVNFYTTSLSTYQSEQPVVIVDKEDNTYSENASVDLIFDLALRKFITKINDTIVSISREPQIDQSEISKLANNEITTVEKIHPKDALEVKTNDKVLYTIRIYNEGNISGYASKVTDYLPTGLKLATDSAINEQYGWQNPSGDGVTIETDYLSNKLIAGFDGNNLKYEDLQVECIVIAEAEDSSINLKNIAEITECKDYNNDIITDRDSQVNNVVLPDYTVQQQDDDDFENLIIRGKYYDFALRKFITQVNDVDVSPSREPVPDVTKLVNGTSTTAEYNHTKTPINLSQGNIVTYTIRVYNEGSLDGYISEITDYLPKELEFIKDDPINIENGWTISDDGRILKTTKLSKDSSDSNLIKAFDGEKLDYKDVIVKCKVSNSVVSDYKLTNIAEITQFTDKNGTVKSSDIDSQPTNVVLPSDTDLPSYKDDEIASGEKYIPGQQDDDDFEKVLVKVQKYDFALRKFITQVNDVDVSPSREPVPDVTKLVNGTSTTAEYNHTKTAINLSQGSIVTYKIRVYNEGQLDGYISEITDYLPKELEFIKDDPINIENGWTISEDGRTLKTTKLSKASSDSNLIKAFDGEKLDYKDVIVKCKVSEAAQVNTKMTNIAEITQFTDKNGTVKSSDVDSQPTNVVLPSDTDLPSYKDDEIASGEKYIPGQQDDDDFEKVQIRLFDLALRKFITGVNDMSVNNRYPEVTMGEDGKLVYNHTKEPVDVENGNIVTYTIRIFNEGTEDGYASEITDDIPNGLKFLPDNSINIEYGWTLTDDGKIKTDYLSKDKEKTSGENLIKAFDINSEVADKNPDYRDVKIAFLVTEPNTSDRIIINTAEITNDSDKDGNPVDDIDSVPDNGKEDEDDIDKEYIKVKYFDLALRKWVTKVNITDGKKVTTTETGHHAEDDPEDVVKVDIPSNKINTIGVKYTYSIRVTNQGQIAGYAKEVKDYIPEGLKFDPKDNPLWTQQEDGSIITTQLKDTLLKPGESADIEVILTWINNEDNMGLKVNVAEISKDYNESNTPDIDSVPDNKKDGEDDIDDAPVILSVKTGNSPKYYLIIVAGVAIISVGTCLIKKYVLGNEHR